MSIREDIETIVKEAVSSDIYFANVYKMKTGIFNPILQTVQCISIIDQSVINNVKLYSTGGMKYLTVPPGTEVLMTFTNGDPAHPVVIGIDPNAPVIMSAISTGIVPGAVTLLPG